jgi:hypothetical protein
MIGGNLLTITDEEIQESLKNHDFPTRKEIKTMIELIEKVTAKLDEL